MEKTEKNITLSDWEQKIVEHSSVWNLQKMLACVPEKCEWIILRIRVMISLKQETIKIRSKTNNILDL